MQKAKRKNKIIIGTTAFMGMMSIVTSALWAFHTPSPIYSTLCWLGIGWCMWFAVANGGDER